MDEIIQDFIDSGHMNKENRDQIKKVLQSSHRHNHHSLSALSSKKSTMSDLFSANQSASGSRRTSTHEPDNSTGNISRKNSFINFSESSKFRKSVKASNSEIDLENRSHAQSVDNTAKLNIGANTQEEQSADHSNFHSIRKNRRSTIALIRSTLGHSKNNKVN